MTAREGSLFTGKNRKSGRRMSKDLVTFGCGAGTQSTALFFLMRDGVIPKPDAAIFSDTGWEPATVYENVEFLRRGFEEIGVPFFIVGRDGDHGDIRGDVLNRQVYATIPAFTVVEKTVRVPLWWDRCNCDWAKIVGIGGPDGVGALRTFAPGTTREKIANHASVHLGSGDCEFCSTSEVDPESSRDAVAVLMLDEAGFGAVPVDHRRCRSEGRIATRIHTYTKVEKGRIKRECTGKYKIEPIEKQIRKLLGATVREVGCKFCGETGRRVAPWDVEAGEGPCSVCRGTKVRRLVGRAPKGSTVKHIIGFSADEILDRATTVGFTKYTTPVYPLTDLGMTREDCSELIVANGRKPIKSACVGCPFHGNAYWRDMRDNHPDDWADAVAFDHEFRTMPGLKGERFLHASCMPLDQAPIDKPTRAQLASGQASLFAELEAGAPGGCSPYACRSSSPTETVELGLPGFAAA